MNEENHFSNSKREGYRPLVLAEEPDQRPVYWLFDVSKRAWVPMAFGDEAQVDSETASLKKALGMIDSLITLLEIHGGAQRRLKDV